ncbi:MAG TPA: hypothetical protein VFZ32_19630 [Micromonosporaceae bacterium]
MIAGDHATVKAWAVETLNELVEGTRACNAVRHPLGFICFPLLRDGDYGTCIHYWPTVLDASSRKVTAVHSHSWHLVSHVLAGRLTNHLSTISDLQSSSSELYVVTSNTSEDVIVPTGRRVRVIEECSTTFIANETHEMTAGKFHWTEFPTDTPTVTVVAGRNEVGRSNFLVDKVGAVPRCVKRRTCSPADSKTTAQRIVELLRDVDRQGLRATQT